MIMKAILYPENGQPVEITPANGADFSLEEMQKLVGGLVECHEIDGKLWCGDEEGIMKNKDINLKVTDMISGKLLGPAVGAWVVCEPSMFK